VIFLEVVLLIVGVVLPWGSDDRGVEICPLIAGNPAVASAASKRSKRTSQGEYGPIFNWKRAGYDSPPGQCQCICSSASATDV